MGLLSVSGATLSVSGLTLSVRGVTRLGELGTGTLGDPSGTLGVRVSESRAISLGESRSSETTVYCSLRTRVSAFVY